MDTSHTRENCHSHALERYLLETDRYKEFLVKDVHHQGELCRFKAHGLGKRGMCLDGEMTTQHQGKIGNLGHICLEVANFHRLIPYIDDVT